jgi:general stress protein CsbA
MRRIYMAITANRYLTLLLLFVGAAISYSVGFTISFWLLIAIGVVFELAFWFELLFRRRT